ncbi:MAG: hypothetical protein M1837_002395 [Sclerophora amabilis]|nr:MAG: hypothetical protein M1837_002395 [Sclerophora amabilis]
MASSDDPRALLRAARASRRITHPQATYTKGGTLTCTVCHIPLKSDALWEPHLRSRQHVLVLQKLRDGTLNKPADAPATPVVRDGEGKKRKADDMEQEDVVRKRTKEETSKVVHGLPGDFFDQAETERAEENETVVEQQQPKIDRVQEVLAKSPPQAPNGGTSSEPAVAEQTVPSSNIPANFFDDPSASAAIPSRPSESASNTVTAIVDEDEWAAFERDIATTAADTDDPSTTSPQRAALTAPSAYSAPAVSAADLAARSSTTDRETVYRNREAELEAEKEDAARQLETEFEEMEGLEERVRKMRERREELRKKGGLDDTGGGTSGVGAPETQASRKEEEAEEDSSDEDESEEGWGFR